MFSAVGFGCNPGKRAENNTRPTPPPVASDTDVPGRSPGLEVLPPRLPGISPVAFVRQPRFLTVAGAAPELIFWGEISHRLPVSSGMKTHARTPRTGRSIAGAGGARKRRAQCVADGWGEEQAQSASPCALRSMSMVRMDSNSASLKREP